MDKSVYFLDLIFDSMLYLATQSENCLISAVLRIKLRKQDMRFRAINKKHDLKYEKFFNACSNL